MDDQLKQSALDFHEFPVPVENPKFLRPNLWQRSVIWRWPIRLASPRLVLKSKKIR